MLDQLNDIEWSSLAQPNWNQLDTVPRALRLLAGCNSEAEGRHAYNEVLYALGNNHAGTYFPVVLAALPFLKEILEAGGECARLRTLDILIDLSGSFWPDPEFETVLTLDGRRVKLRSLVRQYIRRLAPTVEAIIQSEGRPLTEKELATELLRPDGEQDEDIDYSDIPPLTDQFFTRARLELPNAVAVDPDILDWFKNRGEDYTVQINAVLRHYIEIQEQAA